MGMHLLQKMGWKPGEGLGKEKNGSLQPLLLEVKLDKKGLVAEEEVHSKQYSIFNSYSLKMCCLFRKIVESTGCTAACTNGEKGESNNTSNGQTKF